nr:sodium-coupled monocarboxylate transporter 2-like [Onthophagus taurus]
MIIYSPIVVYAPGLIVSHVTKINVHYITPIICLVCILYTVFGGIKAVIWTDALQSLIMIGSSATVIALGIIEHGGIGNVFKTNYETGRFILKFDLDPTLRDTIWSLTFGTYFHVLGIYSFGQSTIQKYLSLKDFKDVKRTNIIASFGLILVFFLCQLCGYVALARYVFCDPKSVNKIQKPDQILPYYIMDLGKSFPGLAGIFVAGVISAGLSTLSAILNSLAATMYNDFLCNLLPNKIVKNHEATTLKFLVAILGVLCVSMVYIIEHLGTTLLPLVTTFLGLTSGPMVGLFFAGMLLPNINATSVLIGGVTSLVILIWIVFTSQWYKTNKMLVYPTLNVYTNSCKFQTNDSSILLNPITNITNVTINDVPWIYRISHHLYPIIGVIVVVVISLIASYFFKNKEPVNEDYLSPVVARYMRRKRYGKSASYVSIEKAHLQLNDIKD